MKLPEFGDAKDKILDPTFDKVRATTVERSHQISVVWKSVFVIIIASLIMFAVIIATGKLLSLGDYLNSIVCNTIALVVVVVFLDTIVSGNSDGRRKREEARAILRHNNLIQPDIDMYLVRKNMVITPNGKTVRKFQIDSDFTIRDMRDMYGPSELVSDVGISKIKRYSYFQKKLSEDFEKLIGDVDFTYYPEIADAVMKYINATSYGEAALDAVVGYENSKSGTRSMRVMVVGMIADEPDDGRFMEANPTMKNVYLVHQMINDQEKAVSEYLRLMDILKGEMPEDKRDRYPETDYE